MLQAWQAVVLGVVEGVTEYLPVSSTGHLILANALLGLDRPEMKPALDAYDVVIQGGAILAVVGLYFPRVLALLNGLLGRDPRGLRLLVNLIVAFLPSALIGLAFEKRIDELLFRPAPVLLALAAGGVFMIALDRARAGGALRPSRGIDDVDWRHALVIGLLQCLALWPGTSRSMTTIVGGLLVGLRPREAAEFSFLLGLPTLGAACLWKFFRHHDEIAALGAGSVVIGIAVATVSAALAVRWLVGFLNSHGLAPFGWYRLGLTALLGLCLWLGWVELGLS